MISVGLVGVGGWGKNHARVLYELGALGAICDTDRARADTYARKYGAKAYYDIESMISSANIQAVHICTPTKTHAEISKRLLEAGLDVFIEKPLADSVAKGKEIADFAAEKRRIVAVGYIERFNPSVMYLKELLQHQKLGSLLLAEFHRENRWNGIKDVGILLDTAVHDIDTARYIFAEEPIQVFARTGKVMGNYEDFAVIMLGFKDHRTAIITTNWVTPRKERKLTAVFTEGVVRIDFIQQEVRIDNALGSTIPYMETKEPLMLEINHFLDCVQKRSKPAVDAYDALKTSIIAEAASYSSAKGLPISLNV
ncbi:MAG: Gfo/Idh/MocA family oxidoreductase [Nitrososphaerota archaeon]